jgi:MerR family transcriptional regulator, copper efflux regulator
VDTFTIGQLAHSAGVNIETVRYYERRGLLRDPPRSDSGYRQYSTDDLWRLQFIARAKRLGFTLSEIASLVAGSEGGDSAESIVAAMARTKLQELDERQRTMDETRLRLTRLMVICEDPKSEDCNSLRVVG